MIYSESSPTHSYDEILKRQIEEGKKQLDRTGKGLFISSLSAGLDIGFGPLLMVAALTFAGGVYSSATMNILLGMLYPIGFIIVVLSRADLFTELDARAVFPVIGDKTSLPRLLRLWGYVIVGNIIGGFIFSALAVYVGTTYGIVEPSSFVELAATYTARTTWQLFLGAIMAGWLMGLVAWLTAAAKSTFSVIFFVWLCTFTIAVLHFPHSIAGNVEVLMGVLAGDGISWADYGRFIVAAVIGNAIGGSVFVAALKYGGKNWSND